MGIRKRGKTYQVYVYDPQEQRQITFTCLTLRQAEKKEAELKQKVSAVTLKKKIPRKVKHNTEEKGKPNEIYINEAVLMYAKSWTLSKTTLSKRIGFFKNLLQDYGNITLQSFADNANVIFNEYISKRTLQPMSIKDYQYKMIIFFNWCIENGLLDKKPIIKKIKNARCRHFVPPTQDELARIIAVSPDHIRRVIIIGSQLGVRVGQSELFKIRWSDVDWNRRVLILQSANKNKNEPYRELPLSDVIFSLFEQWYSSDKLSGNEYVIHWHGRQIKTVCSWREILLRAGITRYFRPYDLRHAFATEAIAAGADPGTVAKLMGHTDTTMIFKHYQHVMDKQKLAVMENLSHSNLCQNLCQTLCHEKLQ